MYLLDKQINFVIKLAFIETWKNKNLKWRENN